MNKRFLIPLLMVCTFQIYAQNSYQKGYFILDNNENIECLINNEDWDVNPYFFNYKLSKESVVREAGIDSVICFEVGGTHKYIKKEVDIDVSGNDLNNFSLQRGPEFETQTLWLKVLVEGEINLYYYKGNNLVRFFIQAEGEEIEQLIFKEYREDFYKYGKNERFKGQLAAYMQCDEKLRTKILNMGYTRRQMIRIFKSYESCSNQTFKFYQPERNGHTNLNFNAGMVFSTLDGFGPAPISHMRKLTLGYTIGTQVEYYFPIKNDKIAFIADPYFQIEQSDFIIKDFYLKYRLNSICVPVGLRYYAYLNKKSGFFFNTGFTMSADINSGVDFYVTKSDGSPSSLIHELDFKLLRWGMFAGMGYRYKDILIEARYNGIVQKLTLWDNYANFYCWNYALKVSYSFDLSKK